MRDTRHRVPRLGLTAVAICRALVRDIFDPYRPELPTCAARDRNGGRSMALPSRTPRQSSQGLCRSAAELNGGDTCSANTSSTSSKPPLCS